jgi:peptidase M15-like protein
MRTFFATLIAVVATLAVAEPAAATIKPPYRPSTSMSCVPTVLRQTLEDLENHFGAVQVISTHRPGAKVAGTGHRSLHADCRAVDFNPPRGKYQEVVAWLKQNHKGGIGTYSCGMHHIHIDNGGRTQWHKCVGGGSKIAKSRKPSHKYAGSRKPSYKYAGSRKPSYKYAASRKPSNKYAESRKPSYKYAKGRKPNGGYASLNKRSRKHA